VRSTNILRTSVGVPDGLMDMLECGGCSSLFPRDAIDIDNDCPVCGHPPTDVDALDRVAKLCSDCRIGCWGISADELAGKVLDILDGKDTE